MSVTTTHEQIMRELIALALAPVSDRGAFSGEVATLLDSWKNLDRAMRNTVCFEGRIACDRTAH